MNLSEKYLGWGGINWHGNGIEEKGSRVDNGEVVIKIDPGLFRPSEVDTLLGDSAKARNKLGWKPNISLKELIKEMLENDLQEAEKEKVLLDKGFKVNNSIEDLTK